MKQYLTPEQTAKLIELGFDKKEIVMQCVPRRGAPKMTLIDKNFSIGELIELLPQVIYIDDTTYSKVINKTEVFYYSWDLQTYALLICDVQAELIDNLYDMIVQLKEEGVI